MSFHVLPFGNDANVNRSANTPTPTKRSGPDGVNFARVYDATVIESARAARLSRVAVPEIPVDALDEVEAAARLYDELTARDEHVRFTVHDLEGRVVADLVDTDGNVVRPISLWDVIDSNLPDSAA